MAYVNSLGVTFDGNIYIVVDDKRYTVVLAYLMYFKGLLSSANLRLTLRNKLIIINFFLPSASLARSLKMSTRHFLYAPPSKEVNHLK